MNKMLIQLLRKIGVVWLTVILTLMAIVLSIFVTYLISIIKGAQPGETNFTTAILAPATIAPLFNYIILSMVARLDKVEQQLRQLSTTDELTQVHNRRHILELAVSECARAKRLSEPLSIVLIDVDFFKKINDTHGHAGGDVALINIAQLCEKNSREIDHFARFGGEEFLYLLPKTDSNTAYEFSERIRKEIEKTKNEYNGIDVSITISLGVAMLDHNEDINSLLLRADKALYRAKEQGKNQTVIA